MNKKNFDLIANKLVKAFLKNKIIAPIPTRFTKKLFIAQKLRKQGFNVIVSGVAPNRDWRKKKIGYESVLFKLLGTYL